MRNALYGPRGFFVREAPRAHFRTSVHASPLFAEAVARLLTRIDALLEQPAGLELVDVGAGRGELLTAVRDALWRTGPALADRVRLRAVELAPRPSGLDPEVEWRSRLPDPGTVTGLVFANEWLDNVPLDVARTDGAGTPRRVLVDRAGTETLGGPVAGPDAAWLGRWWPLGTEPGLRAEIGRPRDAAWAAAVATLRRGFAVAADYGHERAARPPFGTLTGHRAGREVEPVPDGSRDLTAHVAVDACAAAVGAGGAPTTQREALRALGVRGTRPPLALATTDPPAYVRALAAAGEAAELTDPAGLGAFSWLTCPVAMPDPLA